MKKAMVTFMLAACVMWMPLAAAQDELDRVVARRHTEFPDDYPAEWDIGARLLPWREELVRRARPTLLILLGTALSVLLIACANVANLLLARASLRSKEVAVRTALGASRRRVIVQLLSESTVIAVVGAIVGIGNPKSSRTSILSKYINSSAAPFLVLIIS